MFCTVVEEEEVDTCPPESLCGRLAEALRIRFEAELEAANRIIQFNDEDDDSCRVAVTELEDLLTGPIENNSEAKIWAQYIRILAAMINNNVELVDNQEFIEFALSNIRLQGSYAPLNQFDGDHSFIDF